MSRCFRPTRRAGLYTDTCGVPAAGSLAPVISASGGQVVWSDFAHFMDMDDPPVINEDQDGLLSRHPVDVPDLAFDAAQYTAEVRPSQRGPRVGIGPVADSPARRSVPKSGPLAGPGGQRLAPGLDRASRRRRQPVQRDLLGREPRPRHRAHPHDQRGHAGGQSQAHRGLPADYSGRAVASDPPHPPRRTLTRRCGTSTAVLQTHPHNAASRMDVVTKRYSAIGLRDQATPATASWQGCRAAPGGWVTTRAVTSRSCRSSAGPRSWD
jgi:hypothetical protein